VETPLLGLRTVVYRVPDLAAARAWYTEAFQTEPYFDQPYYVGFNISGYELGLLPDDSTAMHTAVNVSTHWGVANIEAEFERLLAVGASACEPPTNVGGPIIVASVKDPWGNVLGLIYNPTFALPA